MEVFVNELRHTAETPIDPKELQRAKNRMSSTLLMGMEEQIHVFEVIAKEIINTGECKPLSYWVEKISRF